MYISDKQQIRFRISLSHALYEVNLCHTRKDAFFSEVSLVRRLVLHLLSLIAAFLGASLPPLTVKHDPGARREATSLADPFLPTAVIPSAFGPQTTYPRLCLDQTSSS